MTRQLRLFDGDGGADDVAPAPEPEPVPRVWHVLPFEIEGFGGTTWPRGEVVCSSRRRALALGEFLCNRLFYEVVVYECVRDTGEIIYKWVYGYLQDSH